MQIRLAVDTNFSSVFTYDQDENSIDLYGARHGPGLQSFCLCTAASRQGWLKRIDALFNEQCPVRAALTKECPVPGRSRYQLAMSKLNPASYLCESSYKVLCRRIARILILKSRYGRSRLAVHQS